MSIDYDILGLGCAAVDELLYVASFPATDTKTRITRRERECGGLGATALVAAARLGGRCAYAGMLGDDALSDFVISSLKDNGIDVSHVVRRPGARPVYSVIIVAENGTRNIFYHPSDQTGADDELPRADLLRRSRVLFLDHYGMTGNIRAAKIARESKIPVVADIEWTDLPRRDELLALVDHLIVSSDIASALSGMSDPAAAAKQLWRFARQTVVVTCGNQGAWLVDAEESAPRHFPAFKVNVVDTTGCGDVFHGAYAWALARQMPVQERIRIASAAAAIKATRPGGQRGAPDLAAVNAFVSANPEVNP